VYDTVLTETENSDLFEGYDAAEV